MNKKIKKWVLILVGIIGLAFAKDIIVGASVGGAVRMVTGLELNMGSFHIGIIPTNVGIKKMKLLNPPDFSDKTMLDAPEIYVKYDLPAVLSGNVHLSEVRIDVKEVMIVKNAQGKLNLDSLKVVQKQKEGRKKEPVAQTKPIKMAIDVLKLKIGKVVYKDYSTGGAPAVTQIDLNLDESYTHITDPNALVGLIVMKALMNTTIGNLVNIDIGGLQSMLGGSLGDTQKAALDAFGKAKKQWETADVTKEAEEAAKKAADVFSGLFGGK